jgi:hypothetical protein
MLFKKFVCAVSSIFLAAGFSFAPQSASAQTWTVTTTGQISYGYDTSGVFGTANSDLTGMTYTQTITTSIDPSQWSEAVETNINSHLYGAGPSFIDTVTVGGHSFSVTAATLIGQQELINSVSSGGTDTDQIYSDQQGQTINGSLLRVYQSAASYSRSFVPGLSFSQTISQDVSNDEFEKTAYFGLFGSERAYFGGVPNSIFVNANPVSEPHMLMMMMCGLGVLGLARRRSVALLP